MKHRKLPELTLLQNLLKYDPETGVIIRKTNGVHYTIGSTFGCMCKKTGYLKARINYVLYNVHRIAFYLGTGIDPEEKQIDHINGIKNDNRLANLRLCNNVENNSAKKAIGTTWHKQSKRWEVRIRHNNKRIRIGMFKDKNDAIKAYKKAKAMLCGSFYTR